MSRENGGVESPSPNCDNGENDKHPCECNLQHDAPCVGCRILGTAREKVRYLRLHRPALNLNPRGRLVADVIWDYMWDALAPRTALLNSSTRPAGTSVGRVMMPLSVPWTSIWAA